MYRALTAELQIHQSPKKNVSSWDQGTEFFGFWKLSEFVNSQAKTHHCFSIVVFSGHVDYTSHGCMTVNLFGAYNIYNITFGNCNKDNSIDCHGLLPLSGNKNLKINKKNTLPDGKKPTVYIYIYHLYTGNNLRTFQYHVGLHGGYTRYTVRYTSQSFGPNLDAWDFPKKKKQSSQLLHWTIWEWFKIDYHRDLLVLHSNEPFLVSSGG